MNYTNIKIFKNRLSWFFLMIFDLRSLQSFIIKLCYFKIFKLKLKYKGNLFKFSFPFSPTFYQISPNSGL